MKDITDYFKSPPKPCPPSKSLKSAQPVEVIAAQNVNNETKIGVNSNSSQKIKENNRTKKRKRKRKRTDPEVKNVAELFSNNLSLISPNTSASEVQQDAKTDKLQEEENSQDINVIVIKDEETVNTTQESKSTSKVNAFQFLMNSRNNVIGQNSGGKPSKEDDVLISEEREKLEARKNLFKNWADHRGAAKRKREDQEIDKCINNKLEKRAKRLKKMLQVGKEDNNLVKLKGRKKAVKRLSSSESEASRDSVVNEQNPFHIEKDPIITETEEKLSNSIYPTKRHTENGQNNLLSFFGVLTKTGKNGSIEVFDESSAELPQKEIIKIKMFTPQKKTLLNRDNIKNVDESSQQSKSKKHKKKKHKAKGKDMPGNSEKLNDSMEDFCSSDATTEKNKPKSKSAKKSKKNEQIKNIDGNDAIDDCPGKMLNKSLENKVKAVEADSVNKINHKPNKYSDLTGKDTAIIPLEENENTATGGRTLRKRTVISYKEKLAIELPKNNKKVKEHNSSTQKSKKAHKDESMEEVHLSSNSDEDIKKNKMMSSTKVAPVFLKATPKPKVDPELVEARKKFLLSGIPDSLKKTVEKQKCIEEKEFDVFPTISHVQQKCKNQFWTLSSFDLNCKDPTPLTLEPKQLKCQNLILQNTSYKIELANKAKTVKHVKTALHKIKLQNPEYPVYKVFRHIYEKSGKNFLAKTKNKETAKRRSKKQQRRSLETEIVHPDSCLKDYEMWTEKYKPRASEEILGNHRSVNSLKNWLETWMNYSEEINANKRKRGGSDSESEFDLTDSSSRDSTRLPGNTIILYGPCGSGKTSAVYAIANELGFKVLEFNASTKRTGKRLLQELQEATQSHQVRKTDANSLATFINSTTNNSENKIHSKNKPSKSTSSDEQKYEPKGRKKMCILLLEDIDLIFEQDEGFLSSLTQLILTSKRPIILTTTDNSSPHVQKFISQYECASFMPLSMHCLAIWLQLVCLVEGLLTDKNDLGNLLEYNKGDIRKTLLEIQFWCQSGGQLESNRTVLFKVVDNVKSEFKAPDVEIPIDFSDDETNSSEDFVNVNCLSSFEICRVNKQYSIPENMDLGVIWWNVPNILDVPFNTTERQLRQKGEEEQLQTTNENSDKFKDQSKLKCLLNLYNSSTLVDSLYKKVDCYNSNEPVVKGWSVNVLDSLELVERKENCYALSMDVIKDLSHTLVNGCVENYKLIEGVNCCLNMALPDSSERRWRANQHISEDFLKDAIPLSYSLDRMSTALDYLPTLRDIARFEEQRASNNTKRGNRFRHYLRDLNSNFKPSICKMACNTLNIG